MLTPAPAPPDRAAGRIDRAWDGRALADARASAAEAQRVRWSQYRAVWQWVERASCRRRGLLRALRRQLGAAARAVPCCDVCAPDAVPVPAGTRSAAGGAAPAADGTLDDAILTIVSSAEPAVGRTRAVEILRGGRSKVVAKHSYDGLPGYGAYAHLGADEVLARVDALVERGTLRSTGGRFPKLASTAAGMSLRVGVLASGQGTNLQAILDTVHGRDGIEVVAVGSDKPGAPALGRAERAGVPAGVFAREDYPDRAARDAAIADWLVGAGVELVVLAGYMQLLSPGFLGRFPRGVVNVHPALLPAFPGLDAVGQALAHGVKVFGVTVHFVDEGVDTGPIILQRAVELPGAGSREEVREALAPIEHALLPEAVRLIARGAVSADPGNPRRVLLLP